MISALEFRALLNLLICSDPYPLEYEEATLKAFADRVAQQAGFTDWIDAYMNMEPK